MKKNDSGIILFDTIYIGDGDIPAWALLTLRLIQWDSVIYNPTDDLMIEYPGEYELAGYNVIAFTATNSEKLNYMIRFSNKRVAYIQDAKALEHDEVADMDIWYVTTSELKDVIERRELWWDVQIVE